MTAQGNRYGAGSRPLIVSTTSVMNDVLRAATRIAPSEATVLITGETGTGKEVMARFVHERGPRAGKAFVPVNCGAIPEALLESELFGHARGAFTGAVAARRGRLAMADGGTLFLDEIGELPLALQVKLLRVLQERVYEPVGSNESVAANFRLVAATNRDLNAEVEAGRFRRDLYYRLMVCPLELPPLRERRGDVSELFLRFWSERGEARPVAPAVLEALERYPWPGNVRELENLVERLSVLAEGAVVTLGDLPPVVRGGAAQVGLPAPAPRPPPPSPPPRWPKWEAPPPAAPMPVPTPPAQAAPAAGQEAPAIHGDAAPLAPARDEGPPPTGHLAPAAAPGESLPAAFGSDTAQAGWSGTAAFAAWTGRAELPPPAWPSAPLPPARADAAPPRPSPPRAPAPTPPPGPATSFPVDLPTLLRRLEDDFIDAALAQARGNKKAAADLLGLQRTTLVEKLRRRCREPLGEPVAAT